MANLIRRRESDLAPAGAAPVNRLDPWRMVEDLMRWDPFSEMTRVPALLGGTAGFVPQFDVKETAEGYLFKADLPGVREEDLDISLAGNQLTVSGKRDAEQTQENERYYAYERMHGSFMRSFTLPVGVDAEHVEADLRDGVLTLKLPKTAEHRPRKISLVDRIKGAVTGEKAKA